MKQFPHALFAVTLLVAAVDGAAAADTPAASPDDWAAARAVRYQGWRAANPDAHARLNRAAKETRTLVAAHRADVGDPAAQAPAIFRTRDSGASYWECALCTEMVIAPAGVYTIGSPADEPGRTRDEGPRRRVAISTALAVGRYEVTRGEYEAFLRDTGHPIRGGCVTDRAKQGTWAPEPHTNLRDPGFAQTDDHPVVCVTWDDAQAYIAWLNARTRGGYRLLTEAEWEYLARAGSTTAYPWGPSADAGCAHANTADAAARRNYPDWPAADCDDGALNTMPVGSYRPNDFGLYDMIGNNGEWVQDCATDSYADLPTDGSATQAGDCTRHLVRSGSWGAPPKDSLVANRIRYPTQQVDDSIGFRLAKTLQ